MKKKRIKKQEPGNSDSIVKGEAERRTSQQTAKRRVRPMGYHGADDERDLNPEE